MDGNRIINHVDSSVSNVSHYFSSYQFKQRKFVSCVVLPMKLLDLLKSREYSSHGYQSTINELLEKIFSQSSNGLIENYDDEHSCCFIRNERTSSHVNLHENIITENIKFSRDVISTICLACSPDGATFASSHGDHTIKVFNFVTSELICVLYGHPRTPWCVKYHPTDSNIVASGCLGFEVKDCIDNFCFSLSYFLCFVGPSLGNILGFLYLLYQI